MSRLLLFAAALAFAAATSAQQYKWVDKDGRTRYGDIPPPGVNATPLRAPPPPASSGAAKSLAEREAEFRKRRQEAAKAQEKQELAAQEAAAKRENCARAREYIRMLESGQRVARLDSKGERYFIDDAERAQELSKARQAAEQSCN